MSGLELAALGRAGFAGPAAALSLAVGVASLLGYLLSGASSSGDSRMTREELRQKLLAELALRKEDDLAAAMPVEESEVLEWTARLPDVVSIGELNSIYSAWRDQNAQEYKGVGTPLGELGYSNVADGPNLSARYSWDGGSEPPDVTDVHSLDDSAESLMRDLSDSSVYSQDQDIARLDTKDFRDGMAAIATQFRPGGSAYQLLMTLSGGRLSALARQNLPAMTNFLQRAQAFAQRVAPSGAVMDRIRLALGVLSPLAVMANILLLNMTKRDDSSGNNTGTLGQPMAGAGGQFPDQVSGAKRSVVTSAGGGVVVNIYFGKRRRTDQSRCGEDICDCGLCYDVEVADEPAPLKARHGGHVSDDGFGDDIDLSLAAMTDEFVARRALTHGDRIDTRRRHWPSNKQRNKKAHAANGNTVAEFMVKVSGHTTHCNCELCVALDLGDEVIDRWCAHYAIEVPRELYHIVRVLLLTRRARNKRTHSLTGNTVRMAGLADAVTLNIARFPVSGAVGLGDSSAMTGPNLVYDATVVETQSAVGTTVWTPCMYNDATGSDLTQAVGFDVAGLGVSSVYRAGLTDVDHSAMLNDVSRVLETGQDTTGVLRASGETVNAGVAVDATRQTAADWLGKIRPCSADVGAKLLLYTNNRLQHSPAPGVCNSPLYARPVADTDAKYSGAPFGLFNKVATVNADSVRFRVVTLAQYLKLEAGLLQYDSYDGTAPVTQKPITDTVYIPWMNAWANAERTTNLAYILGYLTYPFKPSSWVSTMRSAAPESKDSSAPGASCHVPAVVRWAGKHPGYYANGTPEAALRNLRVVFVIIDRQDLPANRSQELSIFNPIRLFVDGAGPSGNPFVTGAYGVHGMDYPAGNALGDWEPTLDVMSHAAAAAYRRWSGMVSEEEAVAANSVVAEFSMLYALPLIVRERLGQVPLMSTSIVLGKGGPFTGSYVFPTNRPFVAAEFTNKRLLQSYTTASGCPLTERFEAGESYAWVPSFEVGTSPAIFNICAASRYFIPARPSTTVVDPRSLGPQNRTNSLKLCAAFDTYAQCKSVPYEWLFGSAVDTPQSRALRAALADRSASLWQRLTRSIVKPLLPTLNANEVKSHVDVDEYDQVVRADIVAHRLAGTTTEWSRKFSWPQAGKMEMLSSTQGMAAEMDLTDYKGDVAFAGALLNCVPSQGSVASMGAAGAWAIAVDGVLRSASRMCAPAYMPQVTTAWANDANPGVAFVSSRQSAPLVVTLPYRTVVGSSLKRPRLVSSDVASLRDGAPNISGRFALSGDIYAPSADSFIDLSLAAMVDNPKDMGGTSRMTDSETTASKAP